MVVDSSIVSAWCFLEPRAEEAQRLIRSGRVVAPRLLAYELTNVAKSKTLRYPEQAERLRDSLLEALALPIQWHDVDPAAVLGLALSARLTAYDASYLWIAQSVGIKLATFDRELAMAARAAGLEA